MEYLEQPLKESYKEIYSKTLQTNQSGTAKSCGNNQQKDMKKKTEKPKTEGTNRTQWIGRLKQWIGSLNISIILHTNGLCCL